MPFVPSDVLEQDREQRRTEEETQRRALAQQEQERQDEERRLTLANELAPAPMRLTSLSALVMPQDAPTAAVAAPQAPETPAEPAPRRLTSLSALGAAPEPTTDLPDPGLFTPPALAAPGPREQAAIERSDFLKNELARTPAPAPRRITSLADLGILPEPSPASPTSFPRSPERAPLPSTGYVDFARKVAAERGLDPAIFERQINQESGFNPTAVSPAGARGIAQIVPKFHPNVNPDDPEAALTYAADLMASHLKKYNGDYRKALAAYNAGPGAVDRYGDVPPIEETQRYVQTILGGEAPKTTNSARNPFKDTSQFGDQTLTVDEAYAACGPAAAVRLASIYGNAIPLRAALDEAKKVGWTAEGGMNGVQNQKALLDRLGIPARLDTSGDWSKIAQDAMNGNPVTVSTTQHYFTISGYDPETSRYFVGKSGTDLKGADAWMTRQEIERLGKGFNGALFVDNPTTPLQSVATAVTRAVQDAPRRLTSLADLGGQAADTAASYVPAVAPIDRTSRLNARVDLTKPENLPPDSANPLDVLNGPLAGPLVGGGRELSGVEQIGRETSADYQRLTQLLQQGKDETDPEVQALQARLNQATRENPFEAAQRNPRTGATDALLGTEQGLLAMAIAPSVTSGVARNVVAGAIDPGGQALGAGLEVATRGAQAVRGLTGAPSPSPAPAAGFVDDGGRTIRGMGQKEPWQMPSAEYVREVQARAARSLEEFPPKLHERIETLDQFSETVQALKQQGRPIYLRSTPDLPGDITRGYSTNYATGAREGGISVDNWSNLEQSARTQGDVGAMLDSHFAYSLKGQGKKSRVYLVDGVETGGRGGDNEALLRPDTIRVIAELNPDALARETKPFADLEYLRAFPKEKALSHKQAVREALETGQPVPEEVLAEYPDLAGKGIASGSPTSRSGLPGGFVEGTGSAARQVAKGAVQGGVAGAAQEYQETGQVTPGGVLKGALLGSVRSGLGTVGPAGLRAGSTVARVLAEDAPAPVAKTPAIEAGERANRALLNQYGDMATNQPGPLPERFEAMRRFLVRKGTDRGVDLAQFEREAERAAGRALTPDEMAYELRRLQPSGAAEIRIQDELKPAIQAVGDDVNWLRAYLTHQDNLDVAAAMGNAKRKFSGGLTVADSRNGLAQMAEELGPERMQRIEQSAEQVWAFGKRLLQRKLDAGLIDQGLFDELTTRYPHYSPTRIVDFLKDAETGAVGGRKLTVRNAGLGRNTVEGTVRQREDPLTSFVRLAYETEALAAKNEAANAFLKLRELHPDGALMIRELKDPLTGKWVERAAPAGYENMAVRVNGEQRFYQMPDYIAQAIKQEPVAAIPILTPLMNVFRAMATQRNPVFLASNALNDTISYALRASARAGGPQALPRVLMELFKAYGDAFQGIFAREYRGNTARFIAGGGGMSGFFSRSPEDIRKVADGLQKANALQIRNMDDLKALIKDVLVLKPVEALGERIELAPRVAAMRLAERAGKTPTQAVLAGRTVTIDFAQGGTTAKVFNQAIPFFNVGVQAGFTPYRALRENPRGFAAVALSTLAAPAVAFEAWNRADPERSRDYDDVPDYIKDAGLVLMLPGSANTDERGNRLPQFVFIPVREYAPFVTLTREAAGRAMGKDPREWADLALQMVAPISPIRGNNPADLVSTFVPLGAGTALQVTTNQDWFRGRRVVSDFADEQASEVSKVLSEAVNKALGMETRPSAIDFTIRDLGAGVAGAALAAGDAAIKSTGGEPLRNDDRPQSFPVVGGLISRFLKDTGGAELDRLQSRTLSDAAKRALKESGVDITVAPVQGSVSYTTRGKTQRAELTRAEQAAYQATTNTLVNEAILQLAEEPAWASATPADREVEAKRRIDRAREQAKNLMLDQLGQQEFERRVAKSAAAEKR